MKIDIKIFKLVEYDSEYIISFGPWGHRRKSKLGYYVEYHLLPVESEEIELFDRRGSLVDETNTVLRDLMVDSIESMFVAELRKEGIGGKQPEQRIIKNLATKFIPLMHADIRNAKVEYDTNTGSWEMN